jgi:hypothetical protein
LWDWGKIDELVASFSRPYSIYVSATSLSGSLPLAIWLKADSLTISALAVAVGGVAGGTALLRTMDKKTAADADVAKTVGASNAPVSA